jgi:ubiquinol-cytochrome c reductase iron-sulfur subunit
MSEGVNKTRRNVLVGSMTAVGAVGAGFVFTPFVRSWNPSAKAKAAGAPVRVNINKIEPGQLVTEEWRGKPVYILRRTPEALEAIKKVEDRVADPASDQEQQPEYAKNQYRSINDEYLVAIGICTHLGCAPKYRPEVGSIPLDTKGWEGGFFCPCHGSMFDLAGRVYKGVPAPTNLEVPPHHFDGSELVIGIDPQEASA